MAHRISPMPHPPSRFLLVTVALSTGIGGFLLGTFVSRPSAGSRPGITAGTQGAQTASTGTSNVGRPKAKDGKDAETENAAVEKFWTTLTMGDEKERLAAWNAMLEKMNAKNAEDVRGLFLKMDKQGRWFIPEWDGFWARWGEVDAQSALGNLKETVGDGYKSSVADKILRGWAKTSPDAARAWLQANRALPYFDSAFSGYLDSIARTDLNRATQDALTIGKGGWLTRSAGALTEQALRQRQMDGMMDWWRSLPDDRSEGSFRQEAIAEVYQRLRRGDDARTGQWLGELAASPYRSERTIEDFASKLAGKDPAAAVTWVANLSPAPDGSFTGIGSAVGSLASRDSPALENWLTQLAPAPLRDQAIAAYVQHLAARADEQTAARWRAQISDSQWASRAGVSGKLRRGNQINRGTAPGG
jgi:hypothetical protein